MSFSIYSNAVKNRECHTSFRLKRMEGIRNYCNLHTSLGEGNSTPLQYSCLANPMDGGAWWAAVHGVAEGWT